MRGALIFVTRVQTNTHIHTEERSVCMLTFGRSAGLALKAKHSSWPRDCGWDGLLWLGSRIKLETTTRENNELIMEMIWQFAGTLDQLWLRLWGQSNGLLLFRILEQKLIYEFVAKSIGRRVVWWMGYRGLINRRWDQCARIWTNAHCSMEVVHYNRFSYLSSWLTGLIKWYIRKWHFSSLTVSLQ